MNDLFPGTGRMPTDDDHSVRPTIAQPLTIDPWVASSLLQKAIRRGDADLAERAAITLHRLRGNGIWRRFLVIAFEDIGVASIDALIKTTAACTAPSWRTDVAGGDERVLCLIARLLAAVPKDRSPDCLISAAQSHPALEDARRRVGAMTIAQRVDYAANDTRPLPERAVAAWCASGVEWGAEHRIGRGDLPGLMSALRHLGVPADLVTATRIAATRTREPIVVMTPLLWLAASAAGDHRVVDCPVPPATMIGDIPSYAFDKHTAVGKSAIHRFAHENHAVRDALAAYVPEYRAKDVACIAAFHVDAAPVSRRFAWDGSAELERLGDEAEMMKAGVPREGVAPLLNVIRDNLDHLNAIRAQLFAPRSERIVRAYRAQGLKITRARR
jgi:hypothetical protein